MFIAEYNWLIPSRVGIVKLTNELSVEELAEVHQNLFNQFLNVGTKPVHLIVDIENMGSFPTNFIQMQKMNSQLLTHPALGWLIVVGSQNAVQRFLASTIAQIFHARVKLSKTRAEAMSILKAVDRTL